jgi:hypothetical protein
MLMFSSFPRRWQLAVLSLSMAISAMLPAQAFEPNAFGYFFAPQVLAPTAVENVLMGPIEATNDKTSAEDIPLVLDNPGAEKGFDPQPDPPGNVQLGGPQPDPPGKQGVGDPHVGDPQGILIGLDQGPAMSPRDPAAAKGLGATQLTPTDNGRVALPGGLPSGGGLLPIPNVGVAGALNTTPCTALPPLTNIGGAANLGTNLGGNLGSAGNLMPQPANLGAALGNINVAPAGRAGGVQQTGPIQNMNLPTNMFLSK